MKIRRTSARQDRTLLVQFSERVSKDSSQEQLDFLDATNFLRKAKAETAVEKAALEKVAEKCAKDYENYLRQKGGFLTKYNPFSPEDDKLKTFRGALKLKTNIEPEDLGKFGKIFGKKEYFKRLFEDEKNRKEYKEKLDSFQKQLEECKRKSSQQPALQPTEDAQNQDSSVHIIKERYQDSYWHTNSHPLTDSDSGSTTSAKDLVSSHSDPNRQNDYRLDADFHNKITSKLSASGSTADLTSAPQTTDFDAEIQATKGYLEASHADSSPDSTSNPNQVNLALKLCVLEAAKESGLTKQEFSKFVLNAKHVGGVGNPKKSDNPPEEGEKDKAIEFSFVFQEKTKALGIYTGRQRADKVNDENWYKSFGLRLTFLPAEVLLDLPEVKEDVSEKIDSADVLTPPLSPAPEPLPPTTPPVSPKPAAVALSTEAGEAAPIPLPPAAGGEPAVPEPTDAVLPPPAEVPASLPPAVAEPPPVSPAPPAAVAVLTEAGAAAASLRGRLTDASTAESPPAAAAGGGEAAAAVSPAAEPRPEAGDALPVPPAAGEDRDAAEVPAPLPPAASLRSRLAAASAAGMPASPDNVEIEVAGGGFGQVSDPVVMPSNLNHPANTKRPSRLVAGQLGRRGSRSGAGR